MLIKTSCDYEWAGLVMPCKRKYFRGLRFIRTRKVKVVINQSTYKCCVRTGSQTLGCITRTDLVRGSRRQPVRMEEQNNIVEGTTPTISSLPDFAQIYAFLQLFGTSLQLPSVTLRELEDFFSHGKHNKTTVTAVFRCVSQL